MGIGNYFKAGKAKPAVEAQQQSVTEKSPYGPVSSGAATPRRGDGPVASSRASIALSERSGRTTKRESFMDEIKHEVMVSHLHHQQQLLMWNTDQSGQYEGVVVRRHRNDYLCAPTPVMDSPFGRGCAMLNVVVSNRTLRRYQPLLTPAGCNDGLIPGHPNVLRMGN